MAQVERASNGKSGDEGKASSAPQTPARRGLFGFGRQSLVDRPGQNGQAANGAKPKRGQSFQFFFGLILFMVGSQVLLYLLSWLGNVLHATNALQSPLAPRSQGVFLLSGLSWFEFFWFALVALLYYALIKTKILPTDPFGSKARARQQAAQGSSARSASAGSGGGKTSAVPTVNVRPVTRADRRAAAQERAAREAAAAAKNAKRTKSGQTSAPQAVQDAAARQGEYDAEYERAKAAQRQMRRRGAKR